jgi:threonine synthase
MQWLYGDDLDAMRQDVDGSVHTDDDVRGTIRRVYEERGYLLDPHSAIAYRGLVDPAGRFGRGGRPGVFLATAHPAKFAEIVEPIVGGPIDRPAPLAEALATPRTLCRLAPSLDALRDVLGG